uniref:Uncharacterized protein n=1 Tax=Ixodes ricinus TaxID=34613 RepID=A0A6B0UTG3_IXORI
MKSRGDGRAPSFDNDLWVDAKESQLAFVSTTAPGTRLRLVLFSVLYRPCIEKGPEVATNDVRNAGRSCCRMSRSWRLGVEVSEKQKYAREKASVAVVAASQLLAAGVSLDRQTCSMTGVCHVYHRCSYDTVRISAGVLCH